MLFMLKISLHGMSNASIMKNYFVVNHGGSCKLECRQAMWTIGIMFLRMD
jgi:hypothetical protein